MKMVAGNWKMNGLLADGIDRARAVADRASAKEGGIRCEVLLCPPATLLHPVHQAIADRPVALGGQDCHEADSGAFTGSVSATMLADAGCRYVIVGHSERRHGLAERDELIRAKAEAALAAGLRPIICVGETLDERDGGNALEVVGQQLASSLPHHAPGAELVVAYEPVWAIGSGRVPENHDIEAMHDYIHLRVAERIDGGGETRILYGGSVKGSNAAEIMGLAHVDGVLVGGASLDPAEFGDIIDAAD